MSEPRFEWDEDKAAANRRKHGVSFEEAATAFDDPRALRVYDAAHSETEDREILIGFSERLRLLLVVSTERHEKTRIISARKANAREADRYEAGS